MKVECKCNIIEKTMLNEVAVSMTLEVDHMIRDTFKAPGQFVHIKCGDGLLLRRPISVCSCGEAYPSDLLRIVFEARGEGTEWLANRPENHSLDVMGLAGNGFDMTPEGRYLLVGGGIGVPPMLGCAQFTGGKSTAIVGFRDESRAMLLEDLEFHCDQLHVATDDGSLGYHGFVDALVRRQLEQDTGYDGVLACGPKLMLRNVAKVAEEFNIPCQVSMEERMGCGVGACLVCACDMADGTRKHVCKHGPVFPAQEVDWNA